MPLHEAAEVDIARLKTVINEKKTSAAAGE